MLSLVYCLGINPFMGGLFLFYVKFKVYNKKEINKTAFLKSLVDICYILS